MRKRDEYLFFYFTFSLLLKIISKVIEYFIFLETIAQYFTKTKVKYNTSLSQLFVPSIELKAKRGDFFLFIEGDDEWEWKKGDRVQPWSRKPITA